MYLVACFVNVSCKRGNGEAEQKLKFAAESLFRSCEQFCSDLDSGYVDPARNLWLTESIPEDLRELEFHHKRLGIYSRPTADFEKNLQKCKSELFLLNGAVMDAYEKRLDIEEEFSKSAAKAYVAQEEIATLEFKRRCKFWASELRRYVSKIDPEVYKAVSTD